MREVCRRAATSHVTVQITSAFQPVDTSVQSFHITRELLIVVSEFGRSPCSRATPIACSACQSLLRDIVSDAPDPPTPASSEASFEALRRSLPSSSSQFKQTCSCQFRKNTQQGRPTTTGVTRSIRAAPPTRHVTPMSSEQTAPSALDCDEPQQGP